VGKRGKSGDNQLTGTKWMKYSFAHVNARIVEENFVKIRVH
jgi:hypothetical protein